MKQVNEVIIPSLRLDLSGQKISESAARRWLHKLGYRLTEAKKGMYVDGHEYDTLEPIESTLGPGEKLHVPLPHDKSIAQSNELCRHLWIKDGWMLLWKKVQGHAIHISDFIVEQTGCLHLSDQQLTKNVRLPPDAVAKFIFDQSSTHGAFTKDALNAKEMNVKPGRKQCKMHSTVIPLDNPNPQLWGKPQDMIFPADLPPGHPDYEFCGQAKGMLWVLEERGLVLMLKALNGGKLVGECQAAHKGSEEPEEIHEDVLHTLTSNTCCMCKVLAAQQDFKDEKPLLQIIIEEADHKCYFLLKFHCELNPIEMYWGWMKAHKAAVDGTFLTAKQLVPEILNSCPMKTIRAFFHKTWHYMDTYR
ncbi:hypothetical protein NEOLEDRAFT_1158895 [Neolentinus lepideus HHB14362 ss-1]|uniref:Uncharacterized protein n=1 Tax=Neolentinus lepideus HHB14362 ss-1 TaxID=1314782 RepID=A0A165NNI8_9AGAM|nr:hypothetical protein NEOLEDRAFT_1158895 [Neolentinus lepideus HHB14362 ss-1]